MKNNTCISEKHAKIMNAIKIPCMHTSNSSSCMLPYADAILQSHYTQLLEARSNIRNTPFTGRHLASQNNSTKIGLVLS